MISSVNIERVFFSMTEVRRSSIVATRLNSREAVTSSGYCNRSLAGAAEAILVPGAALVERAVYRCPDSAAVRVQLVGAVPALPASGEIYFSFRTPLKLPPLFFTCVNLPVESSRFTHVPDGVCTWLRPVTAPRREP